MRTKSIFPLALFLALPPCLAALFSFFLPYGASFINAFTGGEGITVLENTGLPGITLFTLKQAFFSVLVSLAIGLPGAWLTSGKNSRLNSLFRSLSAVSFAMPSILVVLGFVLFFGNSGWINRFLALPLGFISRFFPGTEDILPLRILYKPGAVVLAHGFYNFPLVIRLVGDGLGRARKAYAPAAAALGSSPLMTILTVILPLSLPSIMSAVLLVFLYSFTSFAVVLVLGGGPASTTLAVEIYRHGRIFLNYQNSGILALTETLIAVTVFLGYVFFGRKSRETRTDLQERIMEERPPSFFPRLFLFLYAAVLLFFVLGPILSVPVESFLAKTSRGAGAAFSLRWWASLGDSCLPALFRSLALAFVSASTAVFLAVLAAGAVKLLDDSEGKSHLPAGLIRFFSAAPLISSGVVLGLGWLAMYGRNLARSPWALVIVHSVIALPFAFNSVSEGFRSIPETTLSAAAVFGAGPLRGLLGTAIPLSLDRIRSAWGFAAAISLGELNAVMMIGLEDWETLPLYIYRAAGSYRYGPACAGGTLLILGCAAGFLLSEKRKRYA